MALSLYREVSAGTYAEYQQYGINDGRLPVTTNHDGSLGQVIETKLFVRNDDENRYYTNVKIYGVNKTSVNDLIGTSTGHGVKFAAGSTQPTEAEWSSIDYGNTLTLSDLGASGSGDTSTYLPVWYRVECPAGAEADNPTNIAIRIEFKANVV